MAGNPYPLRSELRKMPARSKKGIVRGYYLPFSGVDFKKSQKSTRENPKIFEIKIISYAC
jgi:hypothetical protein